MNTVPVCPHCHEKILNPVHVRNADIRRDFYLYENDESIACVATRVTYTLHDDEHFECGECGEIIEDDQWLFDITKVEVTHAPESIRSDPTVHEG